MYARVFFMAIISISLLCSCSNADSKNAENGIPGITGEFVGTYKCIDESVRTNSEFLDIYNSSNWPSSNAVVTVTLESKYVMKVTIESSIRIKQFKGIYSVTQKHGKQVYNCSGVEISNGKISYQSLQYGTYENGRAGGWVKGELLDAFQK